MIETFEVPNTPSEFANNSIRKLFFYDVVNDNLTGNVVAATVNNVTAITLTLPSPTARRTSTARLKARPSSSAAQASPVSGTFTVNNYVYANATHAFATLKEFLPTLPNANTTYKLIFQMKDVDSFALFDGASRRSTHRTSQPSRSKPTCTRQQDRRHPDRQHDCRRHQRQRVAVPDSRKVRQGEHHHGGQRHVEVMAEDEANAQTFAAQANLDFTLTCRANFSVADRQL
jgi:hypothetical protein